MTARRTDADDLLALFVLAWRDGAEALGTFCARYPDMAADFTALAHELALVGEPALEVALDEDDEAWLAAACEGLSAPIRDPFADLAPQAYSAIRQTLGIPAAVLSAFRNRLVAAGSVPAGFLSRLADELHVGAADLARYLAGPPQLSPTAQHKADGAPKAPPKMRFETILADAKVSPERQAALLTEDD
jgi:hypothetical protein